MENSHLLKIGRGSYYDRNMNIMSWKDGANLIVGRYCSIARDCTFLLNANHRPDWVTTSTMLRGPVTPELDSYLNNELGHNSSKGDIIIGNDVWIGTQAIIMSGVKIGDGAVIAAGSVVTSNVKPYTVVGGNPAKFLYNRFSQEVIDKLLEIKWWDWSAEMVSRMSRFLWNNDTAEFFRRVSKVSVPKVRLVGVEDDNRKVLFVNDTSSTIRVDAKFIEPYTKMVQHTAFLDMEPDIVYYVWAPYAWRDRDFKVVVRDTDEVLMELTPESKNHISLADFDRSNYLKLLSDREHLYQKRLGMLGVLGEHAWDGLYANYIDVEEGDVVLDVGFNYGFFTLRALNKGAKQVYGFEPSRQIHETIKDIYPDQDKVKIYECAVSDYNGSIVFYDDIGTVASSATFDPGNVVDMYEVKCINLYEFIKENNIDHINFLKVDCEGEEYKIFESIPDEYFANIDKILLEFHQNTGPEVQQLIDKLDRTGFQWMIANPASKLSSLGMLYARKPIITGEVKEPTINDEHNPDKQEETVPDSSGSSN